MDVRQIKKMDVFKRIKFLGWVEETWVKAQNGGQCVHEYDAGIFSQEEQAKGPAVYSSLNPEISSDSPSVRSNGAGFVSVSVDTNHHMVRGR